MQKGLISIIVPIYNIENYLNKCITSIIRQSYKNIEIILVDDGSTDTSGTICDSYALLDSRIKVVHKNNGGLVSARKAGLKCADGEYIGFVDGDDYIDPELFGRLLEIICEKKADFVHSGWKKNDGPDIYGVSKAGTYDLSTFDRSTLIHKCIFDTTSGLSISPSIWSKLYRKDLIISTYQEVPDGLDFGEDMVCLCLCMLKAQRFAAINEAYYHYVIRNSSIMNTNHIGDLEREHKLYKCLSEVLRQYDVHVFLADELKHFYVRNLLIGIKKATRVICPIYCYSDMEELYGKRILIYGAGEVGLDYYVQFRCNMHCTVVAIADRDPEKYHYDFAEVIGLNEIDRYEYDVLIISVLYEKTAEIIRKNLIEAGISGDKIVWKKPNFTV